MSQTVLIKSKCKSCDATGERDERCGGDRHDMWLCSRNLCEVNHGKEKCWSCGGKGYYAEERELYE